MGHKQHKKVTPPLNQISGPELRVARQLRQVTPIRGVPDDLDRYKSFFLYGKKLPPAMEKKAYMMRAVFSMLCEGYNTIAVEQFLEREHKISQASSYRVIADTKEIFGDVMRHNKDGERAIMRERAMALFDKCETIEGQLEILKFEAKILGLLDKDPAERFDPSVLNLVSNIIFTSDPAALHQGTPEETEFTEL